MLPDYEVITLAYGTEDVFTGVTQKDDGQYHYWVTWMDRCCAPKCEYKFQVQNRLNGVVSTSTEKTFRTPKFCAGTP